MANRLKAVKEQRLPPSAHRFDHHAIQAGFSLESWLEWRGLIEAAIEVRSRAHCPYSRYAVGAALMDETFQVHEGANVENVSFGASICGERAAVCKMVASGGRSVTKLALATLDGAFPCGICLQVLSEFIPDPEQTQLAVLSYNQVKVWRFSQLLPYGFVAFDSGTQASLGREPNV